MPGTRKLGKTTSQRMAMLRQQVTDFLATGRMETTVTRCKEIAPLAEKMISLGKEGGLRIPSTECWNGSIGGPMTIYHDVAGKQVNPAVAPAENRLARAHRAFDNIGARATRHKDNLAGCLAVIRGKHGKGNQRH